MRTECDAVNSSLNCVAFTGSPEQTTQHVGIIVVQIHIYNVNKMYNTQKCVLYIYIYDKQKYMQGKYMQGTGYSIATSKRSSFKEMSKGLQRSYGLLSLWL